MKAAMRKTKRLPHCVLPNSLDNLPSPVLHESIMPVAYHASSFSLPLAVILYALSLMAQELVGPVVDRLDSGMVAYGRESAV
eukprot:scaffold108_cov167-Ochromonas_danica.AAC.6